MSYCFRIFRASMICQCPVALEDSGVNTLSHRLFFPLLEVCRHLFCPKIYYEHVKKNVYNMFAVTYAIYMITSQWIFENDILTQSLRFRIIINEYMTKLYLLQNLLNVSQYGSYQLLCYPDELNEENIATHMSSIVYLNM